MTKKESISLLAEDNALNMRFRENVQNNTHVCIIIMAYIFNIIVIIAIVVRAVRVRVACAILLKSERNFRGAG